MKETPKINKDKNLRDPGGSVSGLHPDRSFMLSYAIFVSARSFAH
jgi:hypothetical protein